MIYFTPLMEQLSSPLEQYLKSQTVSDPQIIKAINVYDTIGEYTYCSELMKLVQQILLDPDDIKVQTQLVNQLRNTKISYEQKIALQSTIIKESHQNSQMIQIASDTYQLQSQQLLEQNKILNEKLKQVSKQLLRYQKNVMEGLSTLDNSAIQDSKSPSIVSMISQTNSTKQNLPEIQELQLELMSLSRMAGIKTNAEEPLIQTIKQLQLQVQNLKQQNTQYEAQLLDTNARTMTGEPATYDEQMANMKKLLQSQHNQLQSYKQMETEYARQKILLDEAVKKATILEEQRNEQYTLISELQTQVMSNQHQILYMSEDGNGKLLSKGQNSENTTGPQETGISQEEMIQTQNLTMSSENNNSNLYQSNRQLQQEYDKLQKEYNQLFDDFKIQQTLIKELQSSNLQLQGQAKEYLDVINLQSNEMTQKIKEFDTQASDNEKKNEQLQSSQQEHQQMQHKIDDLIAMDKQNTDLQTQQNDLLLQYRKDNAELQNQNKKLQHKIHKLKKNQEDPSNNHVDEIIANNVEEKEKIEKIVFELKEMLCEQQENEQQSTKGNCVQTLQEIKNELDKIFQSTARSQESPCVIEVESSKQQEEQQDSVGKEENDMSQDENEQIIKNLNNKIQQLQEELQIIVAQFNKCKNNDSNIYVKFYSKNDICIYNSIFPTFDELKEKIQDIFKQLKNNSIIRKDFDKVIENLYSQIKEIVLDEEIAQRYNINFDNVEQVEQREFLIRNQLKCYYNYGTEQYFQIFFAQQLEPILRKSGIENKIQQNSELYITMLTVIMQLVLDNFEITQAKQDDENDQCIVFPAFVKKSYLGNNIQCISAIQCPISEI